MENTNPPNPPMPPMPPQPPQGNPQYQQNPNFQQQQQGYQQAPGGYQQAPGGYQQQFGGGFAGQMDHPKASSVQTLGIMGLIFTFLFGIVGLILNIIALSSSGSAMSDINSNPGKYTDSSRSKIKAGRTCAIIGLSIQGFALIVVLLIVIANA